MNHVTIYCAQKSSRLQYVLNWLLKEQLQLDYTLVQNEKDVNELPFFISYGKHFANAIVIPDTGMLWHQGVKKYDIATGTWNDIPVICYHKDETFSLPFDMLSAIFYLLSRHEEYYPYTPDKHKRYPATESILYENNWLQRPLIDEWVAALANMIAQQSQINLPPRKFSFLPTYDIDIAYAYLHKGVTRITGAFAKDFLGGHIKPIKERYDVLRGKKDPYDSFEFIKQLKPHHVKPIYFILSALKTTVYDKNILPSHPQMQRVVKDLARHGSIGLHPSYFSDKDDVLKKEKETLANITGEDIRISRQHYIKLKLPDTYRRLAGNGILADYSMGYGSHLGFRAATGKSFLWYDLPGETVTGLRIYPFCFMDTTAHYEEKLTAEHAFEKLEAMKRILQKTHSKLITIFHNFSLGTSNEWKGWRENYKLFIKNMEQL